MVGPLDAMGNQRFRGSSFYLLWIAVFRDRDGILKILGAGSRPPVLQGARPFWSVAPVARSTGREQTLQSLRTPAKPGPLGTETAEPAYEINRSFRSAF